MYQQIDTMYKGNVLDTDIDSALRYMDLCNMQTQSNLNNLHIYLSSDLHTIRTPIQSDSYQRSY